MKSVTIPYRQENHGDFDAEWPIQRKVTGWWYITGYFADPAEPAHLYSYQFTLARPRLFGIYPWLLHLALTDVQAGKHYFNQRLTLWHPQVYVTGDSAQFKSLAHLKREASRMLLKVRADTFALDLILDKGKGATWHADDGVLVMGGTEPPTRRTVYYSYTNMPTTGTVSLAGPQGEPRTMQVAGKSWFDRQWGPYALTSINTHWEWFSLRFFDDEEVMLFAFPQCSYFDGTYISREGKKTLVRNYTCTPKRFVEVNGVKFSMGWDLVMPGVKEEKYEIRPLTDGQMNMYYFEMLAGIYDPAGKQVGLCMVELLPGARNSQDKVNPLNMLKKI
jgi:predicted secreted hydrolase